MQPTHRDQLVDRIIEHLGLGRAVTTALPGRTNRVWRHGDVVVRACPVQEAPRWDSRATQQELAARGVAVGPLAPRVVIDGYAVTLYPWVEPLREASWDDVADALVRLWEVDAASLELPVIALVSKVPGRLERIRDMGVDTHVQAVLTAEHQRVGPLVEEILDEHLVVLHGDARPANLLVPHGGPPLWVDLDGLTRGPAPVDLVIAERTLGPQEHAAFAERVGLDVRNWRHFRAVADARALSNAAWLATRLHVDERAGAELEVYLTRLGERRAARLPGS